MSHELDDPLPILREVCLPPIVPIKPTDYRVNPITGCWIWLGALDHQGYPVDEHGRFVAKQVYREHKGEIPEGYQIDHLCWHPKCINPQHLDAKTGVDNQRVAPKTVLTMEKAREIRAKAAGRAPTAVLCQEYGVAPTTIRAVLQNVTWTDPDYKPAWNYHSLRAANPRTVRRVRALRAGGMSYGEIG